MAIRICCTYLRDSKSKNKTNQVFIKALIDIEQRHKERAIEDELKYSKIIHAIQIIRYLKHNTGRFKRSNWQQTLIAMAAAMFEEHKLLEQMVKVNKNQNDLIEKSMHAKST